MLLILLTSSFLSFAATTERADDGYPVWNADNISLVYLSDSTQYVSDPDRILTQEYRDSANYYLNLLNHELDVPSILH